MSWIIKIKCSFHQSHSFYRTQLTLTVLRWLLAVGYAHVKASVYDAFHCHLMGWRLPQTYSHFQYQNIELAFCVMHRHRCNILVINRRCNRKPNDFYFPALATSNGCCILWVMASSARQSFVFPLRKWRHLCCALVSTEPYWIYSCSDWALELRQSTMKHSTQCYRSRVLWSS